MNLFVKDPPSASINFIISQIFKISPPGMSLLVLLSLLHPSSDRRKRLFESDDDLASIV